MRVSDTAMFKKETESRWINEVYVVQTASGKTVQLSDGKTPRRDKLLLLPHDLDTVIQYTPEKNVIKVAIKKHKDKQLYKRENIKKTDAIEGGRGARAGRGVFKYDKHLGH